MTAGQALRTARGGGAIAAVAVVIAAITGGGAGPRSTPNGSQTRVTGRAHQTTATGPARRSAASTSTSTSSAARSGSRRPEENGQSAASGSPLAARLAVARRFSDAYMAYQVARLSPRVGETIKQTCTPAFARSLLSHPVVLPPALIAHPRYLEVFRVASVNPGPDGQVSVSYVSEQLRSDTGAFLLRLTRRAGRWLISSLDA